MAKTFVQDAERITVAAPYAVSSGGGALVGSLFGIALSTVGNGETVVIATEGVWDVIAEGAGSGQAIAIGAAVYWDNTNKRMTATSSGNTKIGVAVATKATTDTTVRVRLNGTA